MTAQGSITRIELITWATQQMERIDEERKRIDEAMNGESGLERLQNLYCEHRELNGAQRVLRAMLGHFDANTVLQGQTKGMANTSDGDDYDHRRKGI